MEFSGVNSVSIKEINRALILKLICTNKDVSRIWLANETGLTRMTLSNIINRLTEKGFLCNVHDLATDNVVGRRPVKVDLAPASPVVAGICISRDVCTGIVMDLKSHIITKIEKALSDEENKETLKEKVVEIAKYLCQSTGRKVLGIGVSSLGPIDIENGIILHPTNFFGITNVSVVQIIEEAVGIPAFLMNEMSAAALAEKYYGEGLGIDDFVYIGITNGIGAGIVSGGELYISENGYSGEFGHSSISFDGPKCSCGNRGCIEIYASVPVMIRLFNEKFGKKFETLAQVNSFAMHEPKGGELLEEIMKKLGIAVTGLVNIIDPSLVIFGDVGCELDISWYKMVEQDVNARMLARESKQIKVLKSKFGKDASVIGSATIVADMIFSNRLKVLGDEQNR